MKLWFVAKLREEFDVTDLGPGPEHHRTQCPQGSKEPFDHDQSKDLYSFDHQKAHSRPLNTVSTPMDTNVKLTRLDEMGELLPDNHEYQRAMGSLMYAAIATRPDIMFAVTQLSQFSHAPREAHWTAVKRVFRYPRRYRRTRHHLRWAEASDSGSKGSLMPIGDRTRRTRSRSPATRS